MSETTETCYHVLVACPWGAVFTRWATREMADGELLRFRLTAFPN